MVAGTAYHHRTPEIGKIDNCYPSHHSHDAQNSQATYSPGLKLIKTSLPLAIFGAVRTHRHQHAADPGFSGADGAVAVLTPFPASWLLQPWACRGLAVPQEAGAHNESLAAGEFGACLCVGAI